MRLEIRNPQNGRITVYSEAYLKQEARRIAKTMKGKLSDWYIDINDKTGATSLHVSADDATKHTSQAL